MFDDPHVFISYAKEDYKKARALYRRFQDANLRVWLDQHSLRTGQDWEMIIPRAISKARFFVVLLSSRAVNKRGYIQREIGLALKVAENLPEGGIFILPVRLEDCAVPERLVRWQWIDLFRRGGIDRLQQDIIGALGDEYEPRKKPKMAMRKPRHDAGSQRIRELLDTTGTFRYCALSSDQYVVSNTHFLVFLGQKPSFFNNAKKHLNSEPLTKLHVEGVIPPEAVYKKHDNAVISTRQEFKSNDRHLLLKSKRTEVVIDRQYWDMFALLTDTNKPLTAYIVDSDTPVCIESHGRLLGLLMPIDPRVLK